MKGTIANTTVMVTAWCGDCCAERRSPEKLGELLRLKRNGTVVWYVPDRRGSTFRLPDGTRGGASETTAVSPRQLALLVDTMLNVLCERHGKGVVSLRDVLAGSANVVINISATP